MEQKGEFEQRPEVKPADQVPFSRPKASPLPWILCVVLFLAAGGLLAWKLLDKGGENKLQCETAIEKDKKQEEGESGNVGGNTGGDEDDDLLGAYEGYRAGDIFIDNDGYAYYDPVLYINSYKMVVKNTDNALGEYGKYSLKGKINYAWMGDPEEVDGYKLPFENVAFAEEMVFGNGDISRYIIIIDKDQNVNAIALDSVDVDSRDQKNVTMTFEARKIGELKNYKGAVAVQQFTRGDGWYNQVIFKDGSRKELDYFNEFVKK